MGESYLGGNRRLLQKPVRNLLLKKGERKEEIDKLRKKKTGIHSKEKEAPKEGKEGRHLNEKMHSL